MSHPARAPRSGIDGQANAAGGRYDVICIAVTAAEVGSVVRPGRVRNRTKTEPEEKAKKPADGVRKKTPPPRKAPARGRYVDEYARPSA